jgi:exopolyphosphatase/guanosine-5'-triphosphate,3'-diphosphate pyrophosphatase
MIVSSVDIGTNTVRCLVALCEEGVLTPVSVHRQIVRLGAGLRTEGRVDPAVLAHLGEVLEDFGRAIRNAGCQNVLAVGTSALRDMRADGVDLVSGLSEKLGFPVRIISGEEEALYTSVGVRAGVGGLEDGLVLDIGGGSTELIRLYDGAIPWWRSLPEGVVHLTEQYFENDPPTEEQIRAVQSRFRALLETLPEDGGATVVGTAGTPTTLAALDLGIDDYDPTLVNGHVLSRETVDIQRKALLGIPASERLELSGMEAGREDLIAAGILMVEEVMDRWGFRELIVSDWGLLEGAAFEAAKGVKGER